MPGLKQLQSIMESVDKTKIVSVCARMDRICFCVEGCVNVATCWQPLFAQVVCLCMLLFVCIVLCVVIIAIFLSSGHITKLASCRSGNQS